MSLLKSWEGEIYHLAIYIRGGVRSKFPWGRGHFLWGVCVSQYMVLGVGGGVRKMTYRGEFRKISERGGCMVSTQNIPPPTMSNTTALVQSMLDANGAKCIWTTKWTVGSIRFYLDMETCVFILIWGKILYCILAGNYKCYYMIQTFKVAFVLYWYCKLWGPGIGVFKNSQLTLNEVSCSCALEQEIIMVGQWWKTKWVDNDVSLDCKFHAVVTRDGPLLTTGGGEDFTFSRCLKNTTFTPKTLLEILKPSRDF